MGQITLIVSAVVVAIIGVAVSPFVRAICWDSFVHPRKQCLWEKRGSQVRELKARIDEPGDLI